MHETLEIIFRSFWTFIGTLILVAIPLDAVCTMWNRWCRTRNIKNQGWPPSHLDADGDHPPTKKED